MPDITMKREHTDRWIKMRLSRARSSGPAASCHMLSSGDCITTTSESEFSVHTVPPLTTTVINAVPGHQTGVASGINNSVASVATLLAIAVFGAITLSSFNRALDRHLESATLSSHVRQTIERAHGRFVIE